MDIAGYASEIIQKSKIAIVLTEYGVIRDASPEAIEILGIPAKTLAGTPLATLVPDLSNESGGEPPRFVYNGKTIQHTAVHLEVPGTIAHILSDVSDTVRSEATLRRRTAQLQSALESLPFDFWINDMDNRTILQNRFSKALWGDMHGVHMEDVTSDPEITRKWRRTNDLAFQGRVSTEEIEYLVDGETRTFRNIVAPVRDGDEIVGILGLNIDIGEYKKALRERDDALRELHHRVKNNLQMILSMVGIERDALPEEPNRPDAVDTFSARIERQIYSIYLVHEQLFRSTGATEIDLVEYLQDLTGYGAAPLLCDDGRVTIEAELAPLFAPIERAVPFGILIQEIVEEISEACCPEAEISIALTPEGTNLHVAVTSSPPVESADAARLLDRVFIQGLLSQIDGTLSAAGAGRGNGYIVSFSPNSL
jgi:two-component sensor histidine kinase